MTTPTDLWGPFALRVRCGPLELRAITDDDIPAIVDLVLAGVHDPAQMPFARPWTDAPSDRLPANTAAYYWSTRASFSPGAWTLDLAVRVDGELVGVQGFSATDYLVVRTGETGSWLGSKFQGKGIGTAMRQAMCALLFDHLEAEEITSAAFTDNPASLAVSRKVGYTDNGTVRVQRRPGELAWSRNLLLTRGRFIRAEHRCESRASHRSAPPSALPRRRKGALETRRDLAHSGPLERVRRQASAHQCFTPVGERLPKRSLGLAGSDASVACQRDAR